MPVSLRKPLRGVIILFLGLLVVGGIGAVGAVQAASQIYSEPAPYLHDPDDRRARPDHDRSKPTVAVLLSRHGTNVADSLAPFEVLAASGGFNVYTVAETQDPVPLTGGLDLLPDYTFQQLDALLDGAPDLIVIPQVKAAGRLEDDPVVEWLRKQRSSGDPTLMSVCMGAKTLAATGEIDDRPATSHWLGLIGLRRSHPEVLWRQGVRFVEDGDVITTAGVLSGVDGALRMVEHEMGAPAATRLAHQLHWKGYRPGQPVGIPRLDPAAADLVALLSASYRWGRPDVGVLLADGVGEIELASAFRPYTELSYLARLHAFSVDGEPIRSRHGLTLVPRGSWQSVRTGLDRVIVPGRQQARDAAASKLRSSTGTKITYLHTKDGFPFDGALDDIARHADAATARWVSKSMQYQTDSPPAGTSWPWGLTLRPMMIFVVSVAICFALLRLWVGRGRPRSSSRAG